MTLGGSAAKMAMRSTWEGGETAGGQDAFSSQGPSPDRVEGKPFRADCARYVPVQSCPVSASQAEGKRGSLSDRLQPGERSPQERACVLTRPSRDEL